MPMFRERPKKPVRAEQWFPNKPVDGVTYPMPEEARANLFGPYLRADDAESLGAILPPLSRWMMTVTPGSWVIYEEGRYLDVCSDGLFQKLYEEVK